VQNHSLEADQADEVVVSQSHILVAAHGSHLVGLSALPGCVVQLIPDTKWENWLDALAMRDRDKAGWVNYINVATDIKPKSLANIVLSRLRKTSTFQVAYGVDYSGLCSSEVVREIRNRQSASEL
jgi:hypothetical protein